jgi:hypothetical protein
VGRRALRWSLGIFVFLAVGFATCLRQQAPPAAPVPPANASAADRAVEVAAVRQALHRYVGSTDLDAPVDVDLAQVAVDSDYALVSWLHDGEGGQAVLRKVGGVWTVVECGPGWLGLHGVCREKVPTEVAKRLLDGLDPNWPSYEQF